MLLLLLLMMLLLLLLMLVLSCTCTDNGISQQVDGPAADGSDYAGV